jgi:hypothetical protein
MTAWRTQSALALTAAFLASGLAPAPTVFVGATWFDGQTPAHPKTHGEGKPKRHHPPSSAKAALLSRRDEAYFFQAALVEDRVGAILESHSFGRPQGTRARNVARAQVWRCCPAAWFHTKAGEVDAEVYLLRPLRTGATTLQAVLWRWAESRHVPVLSHARDMNDSRVGATTATASVAAAGLLRGRAARLYDARLSLPE